MKLRSISCDDWAEILLIQDECYPDLEPESLQALQSKWRVSPLSCFVIEIHKQVVGYCLAHPWHLGNPPSLEQVITADKQANSLYLHDIALSAKAQGKGAGQAALKKLMQLAKQSAYSSLSLVAVQGASSYWMKQGFVVQEIEKSLTGYTPDACYMVLEI
ncbi:GNAT family N-acetyltransferase [Shewanella sp. UCD-KL12]|uniref:GNAT family N-acetyltransferase n=1 Tax=Shewanella sp. UCD-KL12 TaxID=1917163 RepID=UPI0009712D82|nr:GNAT family N-acetyltransferase [Shewanella sp. UCD-KL12]